MLSPSCSLFFETGAHVFSLSLVDCKGTARFRASPSFWVLLLVA